MDAIAVTSYVDAVETHIRAHGLLTLGQLGTAIPRPPELLGHSLRAVLDAFPERVATLPCGDTHVIALPAVAAAAAAVARAEEGGPSVKEVNSSIAAADGWKVPTVDRSLVLIRGPEALETAMADDGLLRGDEDCLRARRAAVDMIFDAESKPLVVVVATSTATYVFECGEALSFSTVCESIKPMLESRTSWTVMHDLHRASFAFQSAEGAPSSSIAAVLDLQLVVEKLSGGKLVNTSLFDVLDFLQQPANPIFITLQARCVIPYYTATLLMCLL
jgi:hypothetical protein